MRLQPEFLSPPGSPVVTIFPLIGFVISEFLEVFNATSSCSRNCDPGSAVDNLEVVPIDAHIYD